LTAGNSPKIRFLYQKNISLLLVFKVELLHDEGERMVFRSIVTLIKYHPLELQQINISTPQRIQKHLSREEDNIRRFYFPFPVLLSPEIDVLLAVKVS